MRTTAGRSWQARVMADTASDGSGTYAPANYIGVTADPTAPADTDTVLSGEITSGTLARAQATFAHTEGASSYTLTRTLTSDQEVSIAKIGVFTAATGGVMAFTSLLTDPAGMVGGDQVQITHTVFL